MRTPPSRFAPLAAVFALTAVGCGRRATAADCQLIVNKSFELEMQESSGGDPQTIRKREDDVRSELDEKIVSCESRRVTEKTMACVRAAMTTGEIDRCLR
jgi:hypothetical protein